MPSDRMLALLGLLAVAGYQNRDKIAESGSTRTLIPAQGGQQSGDCGQQVMAG
jgi:hypothetical protein